MYLPINKFGEVGVILRTEKDVSVILKEFKGVSCNFLFFIYIFFSKSSFFHKPVLIKLPRSFPHHKPFLVTSRISEKQRHDREEQRASSVGAQGHAPLILRSIFLQSFLFFFFFWWFFIFLFFGAL